jgi:transcriptional regulator with XRE-family HTH domain
MTKENFLTRFKSALLHTSLSQSEVAEKSGISKQYLSKILRSEPALSNHYVGLLASAVGVDPVWLANGTGRPPSWINHNREFHLIERATGSYFMKKLTPPEPISFGAIPGDELKENGYVKFPALGQVVIMDNDSGAPIVRKGQAVIVDVDRSPAKNDLVVYWDANKPIIKRYVDFINGEIFFASLDAGLGSTSVSPDEMLSPPMVITSILLFYEEVKQ